MSHGKHRRPRPPRRRYIASATVVTTTGGMVLLAFPSGATAASSSLLTSIARCESGGDPTIVNGTGHGGLFQFDASTWASVGGSGLPQNASVAEQWQRAAILLAQRGTQPWTASQSCWSSGGGSGVVPTSGGGTGATPHARRHAHAIAASIAAPVPTRTRRVRVGVALLPPRRVPDPSGTTTVSQIGGGYQGQWFVEGRARGPGVAAWQQGMTRLGYRLVTDGVYGARSAAATTRLELAHPGLDVERPGIVGPQVWAAVFGGGRARPSDVAATDPRGAGISQRALRTNSSSLGARAVSLAAAQEGTPYVFGGESPGGFDCSGLVQWVYGRLGVNLPRTAAAIQGALTAVPRSQAQPGDVVGLGSGHVGIYVGNGFMIDAPHRGAVVLQRKIWTANYTVYRV